MIPFKMMYNMSMLRHRFLNEQWVGYPEPPSSLILQKCVCLSYLETMVPQLSKCLKFVEGLGVLN